MSIPYDPKDYVTESDVSDALEMLGKGYDQPTVVIEPPRTVTARHNGRMVEVEEPAWVKFSTDFKKELATLNEFSLKVFLYIGLSVDFKTGLAYPGVRKIAEETGMDKSTVIKYEKQLEELGFLTIHRREGTSNIYKPIRFISIGTVRPERTVTGELSGEDGELSGEKSKLSGAQPVNLHNKNNKNQQDIPSKPTARVDRTPEEQALLDKRKLDAAIGIQSQADIDALAHREMITNLYEQEMGYNPIDWWTSRDLTRLMNFLITKTPDEIRQFAAWSKRPFSTFDPVKAKRFPKDVIAFWPLAFEGQAPEPPPVIFHAEDEDDNQYVPNPNPRKR